MEAWILLGVAVVQRPLENEPRRHAKGASNDSRNSTHDDPVSRDDMNERALFSAHTAKHGASALLTPRPHGKRCPSEHDYLENADDGDPDDQAKRPCPLEL